MDRVVRILERDEAPLGDEREQAEHAHLIGSRDEHPAARLDDPEQFAHEPVRALEVLDRFDRGDDVGGRRRNRNALAIEIGAMERRLGRQGRMTHHVDADVVGCQVRREFAKASNPATHVQERAASAARAQHCRAGAIDRIAALALRLQRPLDCPFRHRHRHAAAVTGRDSMVRARSGNTTSGATRACAWAGPLAPRRRRTSAAPTSSRSAWTSAS